MTASEIINLVLGGGLVALLTGLLSMRSTLRQAKAKAWRSEVEAEQVNVDNVEHATRILMDNIVKPLKEELHETQRDLRLNRREMARLRRSIDTANSCPHRDECPVLDKLREPSSDPAVAGDGGADGSDKGGHGAAGGEDQGDGDGASGDSGDAAAAGEPHRAAGRRRVQGRERERKDERDGPQGV